MRTSEPGIMVASNAIMDVPRTGAMHSRPAARRTALHEQASQVCFLLNTAISCIRRRRAVDVIGSIQRAASIIDKAAAQIDRHLTTLRTLVNGFATPSAPRVLCIDDNCDVADSEVLLFRAAGIEARACYRSGDALAEALAFGPTVCVIDLNMPGMDGDELGRRLREQSRQPLILVAVTAMDNAASRERIKAAGFDWHLVKPADPVKLLALVEQVEKNARP